MHSDALNILQAIMQWVVAPVALFVWLIYRTQQDHATQLAVLEANAESMKNAHDREMKEIRETTRAIMQKLDSIEEALRK